MVQAPGCGLLPRQPEQTETARLHNCLGMPRCERSVGPCLEWLSERAGISASVKGHRKGFAGVPMSSAESKLAAILVASVTLAARGPLVLSQKETRPGGGGKKHVLGVFRERAGFHVTWAWPLSRGGPLPQARHLPKASHRPLFRSHQCPLMQLGPRVLVTGEEPRPEAA